MCDTMVALGNSTADGSVILAKNSDREPNEAQQIVVIPHATHEEGATVKCTYIDIPQVRETYQVLLSKPFWIWGCEMGANECGVAIGNEAVFTKVPARVEPGLIGMDFIRLALERADTARGALEVITNLLETYGQSGNCGLTQESSYHNSFLIADTTEAWVLETVDKFWAAERVRDVRTISNKLTIGREWDLASPGLVEYATERGWCRSRDDFHFARCYSDFLYTHLAAGAARQRRTTELLRAEQGQITVETMMAVLRDHGARAAANPAWHPGGIANPTVCAHASWGPIRGWQSTGSLVSHLAPDLQTHWVTGTSAPCTGVFKPVYLQGAGLPDLGSQPTATYDPDSLWWAHERLHRQVLRDYPTRLSLYREERDGLESEFLAQAAEIVERGGWSGESDRGFAPRSTLNAARPLAAFTASCFERASEATEGWLEAVCSADVRHKPSWLFRRAWGRFNRQAGMEELV
ncbi:MAG: C69 family dipeptidase [Chloroflexota bacterium]|nr:C69 family dipeptidase [Chloroflexota bacterium]